MGDTENTQGTDQAGEDTGNTETTTPEPAASPGQEPKSEELDYKALYEAEQKKVKSITSESIKRKERLKELEAEEAKRQEAAKEAERKKMGEIERLQAEKADLEKTIQERDGQLTAKEKALFQTQIDFAAAKQGAKNEKYIRFRVQEHLDGLESKEDFKLDDFIKQLKKDEPDQFGSAKAAKPPAKPAHTSDDADDTPGEANPYGDKKIGRVESQADEERLEAGWDALDAQIASMT